jgi:hypothetical protein
MGLAENDNIVQALAADRSNQPRQSHSAKVKPGR